MSSQVNLAPKASASSPGGGNLNTIGIGSLSLQDSSDDDNMNNNIHRANSISPTGALINGDDEPSNMSLLTSPPPRRRTSSHDALFSPTSATISGGAGGGGGGNRSRAGSNTSSTIVSSNPGGSADTRRRITKLSKAREREKVPRLVEYFCVVSSVPQLSGGDGSGDSGGGGYYERSGNVGPPPRSPPRSSSKSILRVEPITSQTQQDDATKEMSIYKTPKLDGSEFAPQITARYPLEDHEENPLLV